MIREDWGSGWDMRLRGVHVDGIRDGATDQGRSGDVGRRSMDKRKGVRWLGRDVSH